MRLKPSTYWTCQFFGWGLFVLINVFFALAFTKFERNLVERLLIFVGLAFSFSHLMRFSIVRSNLFNKPLRWQVIAFILVTLLFAIAVGSLESLITRLLGIRSWQENTSGEWKGVISNVFASFVYLFVWNCIYFSYHYVQRSRRQHLETLKLKALIKTLEQNMGSG